MAKYILNMGGGGDSETYDTVDVFNVTKNRIEEVTDHNLTLSIARSNAAAATCGEYILAMGGNDGTNYWDTVDIFKATENGVEAVPDHGLALSVPRRTIAAAAGNYVLAMGGYDGHEFFDTVDVFKVTENGVEEITEHGLSLSQGRVTFSAAAGNYILAMGGNPGTGTSNVVDVFHVTDNGVEKVTDHGLALSEARRQLAAVGCGNYILAVGGNNGTASPSGVVDVFHVTENGVEAVTDHGLTLSVPRYDLSAVAIKDYILVMGGLNRSLLSDVVDVFKVTDNGIEHILDHGLSLSVARRNIASAAIGNYILAMGGKDAAALNTIDIFQIINK